MVRVMRVLIQRTKMIGGGNSYEVYVAEADCDRANEWRMATIIGGDRWLPMDHACRVLDDEFMDMDCGFEKYDRGKVCEAAGKVLARHLIHGYFPETRGESDFTLWVNLDKHYESEDVAADLIGIPATLSGLKVSMDAPMQVMETVAIRSCLAGTGL